MSHEPSSFRDHPASYEDALSGGRFRAVGERAVDGDTLDASIDLGFRVYPYLRLRLDGIDTPEIYGVERESEEYARGTEARDLVASVVEDRPLLVQSHEEQTFGRWVATVWVHLEGSWQNLASLLRAEGFAT